MTPRSSVIKFITRKKVFAQLKNDLIGKDSYRGVTLTYSWLANQFGHFSLGFIPTIILYTLVKAQSGENHLEIWTPMIIWSIWILFEAYNLTAPILFGQGTKRSISRVSRTFSPDWHNLIFDTLTDLCFFGIGAWSAGLVCGWSMPAMVLLTILCLLSIYPSYYWYSTKIYLQNAGYPFQLRLSQWPLNLTQPHKEAILEFMSHEATGKHLLVFGSKGSGKTTLSVAIATELSIRNHRCSYVTATKLLSMFYEKDSSITGTPGLWSWYDSSLLVIDDINPGGFIKQDILTATLFYEFLNNSRYGQFNIDQMKNKNVIWVMGNRTPSPELEEQWEILLGLIGIQKSDICTVNLDQLD